METWGVAGFDSLRDFTERSFEFADEEYYVCIDAVYRIVGTLKGRLINIEKEFLAEENEMNDRGRTSEIYHIDFTLEGKTRRFTYCQHYLESNERVSLHDYLVTQEPDAILLKGIPDGLYKNNNLN